MEERSRRKSIRRNVCSLLFNFYSICIQIERIRNQRWILEGCHVGVIWIFCLIFYSICIQIERVVVLRNKNCWNSRRFFFFFSNGAI